MKKVLRASCLCVAALAATAPPAASAERPAASCAVSGYATFLTRNLRVMPTPGLGYEFHGPVTCELVPSRELREGTVAAEGTETLSCAGSLGEGEGKGTLTFGAIKLPFTLTFFGGSPGSTGLAAKFADGGLAVGSVTFLGSEYERADSCFTLEGAHTLQFKGAAGGEL